MQCFKMSTAPETNRNQTPHKMSGYGYVESLDDISAGGSNRVVRRMSAYKAICSYDSEEEYDEISVLRNEEGDEEDASTSPLPARKRSRRCDVTEGKEHADWQRRESMRFLLSDQQSIRRYCAKYLAATKSELKQPRFDSAEMRALVDKCREWREQQWQARALQKREKRTEQQRLRRQRQRAQKQSPESDSGVTTPPPMPMLGIRNADSTLTSPTASASSSSAMSISPPRLVTTTAEAAAAAKAPLLAKFFLDETSAALLLTTLQRHTNE